MPISCADVCSDLVAKLTAAGYELGDDEDHVPIVDALADAQLVKPTGAAILDTLRLQLVKEWHIEQHGAGPCGKSCGLERALRGDTREESDVN